MPDPRPLYHLPAVAKADTVVLVEGEKCADALMHIGIVATTAIGKTDWSPLAGKTVIVWPDHDEAGARYANVVVPKLLGIGARVRRIHVPEDKPQKWDAADTVPLFAPDPATRGPSTTPAWLALEQQLTILAGLRLIILDPLQPLCALDLNVPENAQFVCSRLAALAASTGASVIVSHHFAKREASTPEQAREAIRGTGGLVDRVRSVYALWNPKEDQAKAICKALGEPFERGRVVMGGVVKANGRANLRVTTFLRDSRGLLVERSDALVRARQTDVDLLPDLKAAIARAAAEGKPYTKTGGNGVYERHHKLPEAFHNQSRCGFHPLPAKTVPGWGWERANPATAPLSRFPAIPL